MQTRVDPGDAASVSVSSYELCSVDLKGLVILVSSIHFDSHTPSASSSMRFPKLSTEGFDGDIPFKAGYSRSLAHNDWLWVSAVGGSFSVDG